MGPDHVTVLFNLILFDSTEKSYTLAEIRSQDLSNYIWLN